MAFMLKMAVFETYFFDLLRCIDDPPQNDYSLQLFFAFYFINKIFKKNSQHRSASKSKLLLIHF